MEHARPAYQDRITIDTAILMGKPVIRGTRIAVEHVLQQLADNPDVTELFEVFPDLTMQDVQACLACAQALTDGGSVKPAPGPHRPEGRAAHRSV